MNLQIRRLTEGDQGAAVAYLNRRPLSNLVALTLIAEHGVVNPQHRGSFYGCYGDGGLMGVSLLGHCSLLAGDGGTAAAFARAACRMADCQVRNVLGERGLVETFDSGYAASGAATRAQKDPQLLLTLKSLAEADGWTGSPSPATHADIEAVAQAHAQAHLEAVGTDPRLTDWDAFRRRVAARVEAGKVWVLKDEQGVRFKADQIGSAAEASYVEGVWTRPDLRGQGVGTRAIQALCRHFLSRSRAVCLYVDARRPELLNFYFKAGFKAEGEYTILRYLPAAT